jgi:hypothetical protein
MQSQSSPALAESREIRLLAREIYRFRDNGKAVLRALKVVGEIRPSNRGH